MFAPHTTLGFPGHLSSYGALTDTPLASVPEGQSRRQPHLLSRCSPCENPFFHCTAPFDPSKLCDVGHGFCICAVFFCVQCNPLVNCPCTPSMRVGLPPCCLVAGCQLFKLMFAHNKYLFAQFLPSLGDMQIWVSPERCLLPTNTGCTKRRSNGSFHLACLLCCFSPGAWWVLLLNGIHGAEGPLNVPEVPPVACPMDQKAVTSVCGLSLFSLAPDFFLY